MNATVYFSVNMYKLHWEDRSWPVNKIRDFYIAVNAIYNKLTVKERGEMLRNKPSCHESIPKNSSPYNVGRLN